MFRYRHSKPITPPTNNPIIKTTMNTTATTAMNTTTTTTLNTTATTAMNTDQTKRPESMMKMIKSIPARFQIKLILSLDALQKSEWYRKVSDPQTLSALLGQAEQWLQRHPSSSPVYRYMLRIVGVLRHMNMNGQLFTKRNALILAAIVLYTISPADVVPDVLPAAGMLDDLLLLILGVRLMQGESLETPATGTGETKHHKTDKH